MRTGTPESWAWLPMGAPMGWDSESLAALLDVDAPRLAERVDGVRQISSHASEGLVELVFECVCEGMVERVVVITTKVVGSVGRGDTVVLTDPEARDVSAARAILTRSSGRV